MNIQETLTVESPCYKSLPISLTVLNPFSESGTFRIILVELDGDCSLAGNCRLERQTADGKETGSKSAAKRGLETRNRNSTASRDRTCKHGDTGLLSVG